MSHFAVRITTTKEKLLPVFGSWSSVCSKILAYEHPEKDNIHTHVLIWGCSQTSVNLKNLAKACGLHDMKGNGSWTFKTSYKNKVTKEVIPITENTYQKFITYMSKGKYDPYYNKGYEVNELDTLKSKWEQPNPAKGRLACLFEDFSKIMSADYEATKTTARNSERTEWEVVYAMSRNYCYTRNGCLYSIQVLQDAKMLALTYCQREEISIPWGKLNT